MPAVPGAWLRPRRPWRPVPAETVPEPDWQSPAEVSRPLIMMGAGPMAFRLAEELALCDYARPVLLLGGCGAPLRKL